MSMVLMQETLNQSHIGEFSEEEKVQIQQVLFDYEWNIIDEEDMNIISDLDIHIE